jgi:hypothetical protein
LEIPVDFKTFKLPDIRVIAHKHNLVLSQWLGFHKNSEFKIRAALFHIRQFDHANEAYWRVQGAPDAVTIFNHDHPVKEVMFFEFLAATAALLGAIDSLVQEVNCAFRLGLSPTREEGKREVTLGAVVKILEKSRPDSKILERLLKLQNSSEDEWFGFLRRLRNTALHADLYSNSSECRDIPKILARLDAKAQRGELKSRADIESEQKRDVVFQLDEKQFFIDGLIHSLAKQSIDWLSEMYGQFDRDLSLPSK